jgi:hypothetical protein
MKKNQLLAVLTSGLLAAPMAALADYDFQLLDHPAMPDTQVFGVNHHGDVVGHGFDDTGVFPFVFASKKGTFTLVTPASGYAGTAALGINDAGVIAGSVDSSVGFASSGYIRSTDGTYTVFSHPDAPSFTLPRGINNQGLISGYYQPAGPPFTLVGFIYDPKTGSFTDIDAGSSIQTITHGINANGQVVGDSFFSGDDAPCPSAQGFISRFGWLRAADGTVTYIEVNGQSTAVRGINDAGYVVGFINDGTGLKGFVIKPTGAPCESHTVAASDLLDFPGFDDTIPEGITNTGVVVGNARSLGSCPACRHGFIATPQ